MKHNSVRISFMYKWWHEWLKSLEKYTERINATVYNRDGQHLHVKLPANRSFAWLGFLGFLFTLRKKVNYTRFGRKAWQSSKKTVWHTPFMRFYNGNKKIRVMPRIWHLPFYWLTLIWRFE